MNEDPRVNETLQFQKGFLLLFNYSSIINAVKLFFKIVTFPGVGFIRCCFFGPQSEWNECSEFLEIVLLSPWKDFENLRDTA